MRGAHLGVFFDEITHELLAPGVTKHDDLDPSTPKEIFFADERAVLTNHDTRNAVKQDGTRTHATWAFVFSRDEVQKRTKAKGRVARTITPPPFSVVRHKTNLAHARTHTLT
jgi:hypothetical protein